MGKKETAKRYLILFFGMVFISFGIAIITKADLGTSPISAIPYSLSLILSFFTMGNWTIIFNLLLMVVEIILLKGKVSKLEIAVQVGLTFVFGYCIDFFMFVLTYFDPQIYVTRLISLVIGCCTLSFGAYLQVIADVAMLPGDAFVRAIVKVTGKEFGTVRVISDSSMTLTGAALCLIFLHNLAGVREGTIIASLIVGNIVKVYIRLCGGLESFLLPENKLRSQTAEPKREVQSVSPKSTFVLTISREFGTGGREIGKKLAAKLGISYYDSDIIREMALASGYVKDFVQKSDKVISSFLLYDFYSWYTAALNETDMPKQEQLFLAESKIITEIAQRESCVIVGRLAGYILQDHPHCLNVFLHSEPASRVKRIIARDQITAAAAEAKIQRVDKERANYCRAFADAKWGSLQNYDITIRCDKYGIDGTAAILADLAKPEMAKLS